MPDSSSAPSGADDCLLWTLPQELVCQIFDYAYGEWRVAWFELCHLEWEMAGEESSKAGKLTDEQKLPPFEYAIEKFLVSKRFFANAVPVFMQCQTLCDVWEQSGENRNVHGLHLFKLFCTEARSSSIDIMQQLQHFAQLRTLTIDATFMHLREEGLIRSKCPYREILTEEDYERLPVTKILKQFRGIITFSYNSDNMFWAADREKERILWEQNVAGLADYLRRFMTQSKARSPYQISPTYTGPAPLYPGSRVTGVGEPSKLLTSAQLEDMFGPSTSEATDVA